MYRSYIERKPLKKPLWSINDYLLYNIIIKIHFHNFFIMYLFTHFTTIIYPKDKGLVPNIYNKFKISQHAFNLYNLRLI